MLVLVFELYLYLILLLRSRLINLIIKNGDWGAEYGYIREKQRGMDGMVRGMEFSSNGDVEQNNGGAADWQEVMQGVKQGVRIHQLYRCFF
jgi:hypothetical protein